MAGCMCNRIYVGMEIQISMCIAVFECHDMSLWHVSPGHVMLPCRVTLTYQSKSWHITMTGNHDVIVMLITNVTLQRHVSWSYMTCWTNLTHPIWLAFIVVTCHCLMSLSVIINVTNLIFPLTDDVETRHPSPHPDDIASFRHCQTGHSCAIIPTVFTWFDPCCEWHQPTTDTSLPNYSFNLCTVSDRWLHLLLPPNTLPPSPCPQIALPTILAGVIDLRYNLRVKLQADSSIMYIQKDIKGLGAQLPAS